MRKAFGQKQLFLKKWPDGHYQDKKHFVMSLVNFDQSSDLIYQWAKLWWNYFKQESYTVAGKELIPINIGIFIKKYFKGS